LDENESSAGGRRVIGSSQHDHTKTSIIRVAVTTVLISAAALLLLTRLAPTNIEDRVRPGAPDPRGFQFMRVGVDDGMPVRYDACSPIHYVINPALAPEEGVIDVHRAFEVMSEATGLRFVYDGETNESFSNDRDPFQPDRYGNRWAPILVGWSAEPLTVDGAVEAGPDQPIGVGGSYAVLNSSDIPVYVSGIAIFDANLELGSGFAGETWGQVMLHELGHVVGLDHFAGQDAVMNDRLHLRPATWSPGERTGLWELGIGSTCVAAPDTP
jgi:hypothetical protein